MKICNPLGWPLSSTADGVYYEFAPFSEKDVWNDAHARTLVKHMKDHGLVHLMFDDNLQKKYGTYEAFVIAQKKAGLESALKSYTRAMHDEMQAMREVKERNGGEADRAMMNPDRFEKNCDQIKSWISALTKVKATPAVEDTPAISTKKGPRGKKAQAPVDEPAANSHQG